MSSKHYEAQYGFADHLALIVCFLQEVGAETKVSIYGMSTLHCEQHTETWTLMNSKGQIFLWHFCKILKKHAYSFPLVSFDTKNPAKMTFLSYLAIPIPFYLLLSQPVLLQPAQTIQIKLNAR